MKCLLQLIINFLDGFIHSKSAEIINTLSLTPQLKDLSQSLLMILQSNKYSETGTMLTLAFLFLHSFLVSLQAKWSLILLFKTLFWEEDFSTKDMSIYLSLQVYILVWVTQLTDFKDSFQTDYLKRELKKFLSTITLLNLWVKPHGNIFTLEEADHQTNDRYITQI